MENKIRSYKDLIVWQKAMEFITSVYTISSSFPPQEKYGIASQLNRAAVSIAANIAEGWGRDSSKNYLHFLKISRGSLMEAETLLIVVTNLKFISAEVSDNILKDADEVGKILQGLIKSIENKITVTDY